MSDRSDRQAARDRAVDRWERISSWPFLVLSLVFVVVYTIWCLDPDVSRTQLVVIGSVLIVIWLIFVVDYVVRLTVSTHKWQFVRHNVPDLLAALLPVFRPFRAIKELHRIQYFRRRTGAAVRARLISYGVAFVVLWIYTMSVTIVHAERGAHGATIVSLGDAIYWSFVTMATVGYGDLVPVTTLGRVLAVMLMLSGVVIVGVTTATLVSYLGDAIRIRTRSGSDTEESDEER